MVRNGGRPWAVVGRGSELQAAGRWLDAVARGDGPGPLVLHGDAGIGKSTLWQQVGDDAGQIGGLVLSARCGESETTLGYAGLADLLGPVATRWRGSLPEPLSVALAAALMLAPRSLTTAPLAVMRGAQLAFEAAAEGTPFLILSIDDVQWLDAESARAVSYVLRRWTLGPVGLVATWRAGTVEPIGLRALPGVMESLEIGPLDEYSLTQILADRSAHALSGARLRQVLRDSGGNPFYALALANAPVGVDLPAGLDSLCTARIAGARENATAAIDIVAVRGPLPAAALVTQGLGSSVDDAIRSGVLTEIDGAVRFDHPLLARAAYLRLPPGRRIRLHHEAAAAAVSIEERAIHLARATAGPNHTVATLLDNASLAARARNAHDAAGTLAREAVRLTDPADITFLARRLADVAGSWSSCRPEAAAAAADRVLALGVRGVDRARALQAKEDTSNDWEESLRWLGEAKAEPGLEPVLSVNLRAEYAWISGCQRGSDLDAAWEEARSAVDAAAGMPPDVRIGVMGVWCRLSSLRGDPEAKDRFEECLTLDGPDVQPSNGFFVRIPYAWHLAAHGLWADAITQLDAQEEAAIRHGNDAALGLAYQTRARLELTRGDADALDRCLAHLRTSTIDDTLSRTELMVASALAQARRGDPIARETAASVPGINLEDLAFGPGWVTRTVDAIVKVSDGRPELAADEFGSWLDLVADTPIPRPELVPLFPEAVTALTAAGRHSDAAALLDSLNRPGRPDPLASVIEECGRGVIALGKGETARARALLERSRVAAETIDARWLLAHATYSLGQALHRDGRRTEAARSFTVAATHFEAMRAEIWAKRSRQRAAAAVPRPHRPFTLTPAEMNVAKAAATGMSNADIAAALSVTVPTVEVHLTRIYRKLGIRSRASLGGRLQDLEQTTVR
ncbi:MAG TPA: AAA family ATPase [Pedococcus sp.]|jgi:DNA-binding CsgD family transcriptional regulator|nr:AAA family ATPase [Pedococcus sp.]